MSTAPSKGIPLVGPILNRIVGTRNERFVKKYTARVNAINALEPEMRALTDAQLRDKLPEFRQRIKDGSKPIDLIDETFAVAREAMDRAVGIRNIFNPEHNFDPSRLPEHLQSVYAELKARMDATPDLVPMTALDVKSQLTKEQIDAAQTPEAETFLGSEEPIPGWKQLDIPNELYEAVRELYPESRPPFRARPFDVQLIGAMVLYQGRIAEMKTGEGKTIVAPLACYHAAVEGLKVHVVTVNDYLVQRDRDWTAPFFHALGMNVGAIHPMHMQPEVIKREMYRCDAVYGTTAEFGFDYLRDNMKRSADQQVQKIRELAIVDEVDSTLIDEARTPLIISGEAHEDTPRYEQADKLARHLVDKQKPWQHADDEVQRCLQRIKGIEGDIRNASSGEASNLNAKLKEAKKQLPLLEQERLNHTQYFEIEMERKQSHLTHEGITEAQKAAGLGSFYVGENMDLPHLLEQSLRAHVVYERDRDYVVLPTPNPRTGKQEQSIVIVDVNTGRPMIGRQWSDGLHQAVECKERVPIRQETQTVASITIQNFFKMYKRLAGMTGTADTEAQEFYDIYNMDVVVIPTNKPVIRADHNDVMFLREKAKWEAIVEEIKALHDVGRPVLVGTTSVEKSERLAHMLKNKHHIDHQVLNAKQHEKEAHLIENAGKLGAVMIATNMAGRGTDIKLGSISREMLLDHWLRRSIASKGLTVEATDEQLRENVYRKIAPKELGINKREAEQLDFVDLELQLLRAWATEHTLASPKWVASASADDLRKALDETGGFLLHRIRWFETIEQLGGLHVIGTERHESRRIDNQLRGRSGRQGDRGSSRFFVSFEDDLMKLFAGERMQAFLRRFGGMNEDRAIEHPWLNKSVERAQRKVEERNFQIRKNILEYDEIMEHQRQKFYSLRQRILEGRDVKALIFNYLSDAVADAVEMYLDRDYPAHCAAEYAHQTLNCQILSDRLKGKDAQEMEDAIRKDAKSDARSTIHVTLGEYMPDDASDVSVDFDAAGLAEWAKHTYNVEFDVIELREQGMANRHQIEQQLYDAACDQIDQADLSGINRYTSADYGIQELADWAKNKFDLTIDTDKVKASVAQGQLEDVVDQLMDRLTEMYHDREVQTPVDFAIEMTMATMRQSPQQAMAQLVRWANQRFRMGWTEETVKTMNPQKTRELLLEASHKFVDENEVEHRADHAAACETDEQLTEFFTENFSNQPPRDILRLSGEDRAQAVRSRVESALRSELLMVEQKLLLDTLDDLWKQHLYTMDQLRDTINYRAFSQQDPRIAYKREGSALFSRMEDSVRDRVTDYIFKAKVRPNIPQHPPQGRPPRPQQRPAGQPRPAASPLGSSISGPGFPPPSPIFSYSSSLLTALNSPT